MNHTLKKMDHTWDNGSHLEEWVTHKTMGHTEKWVTLLNMVRTWKNGSLLEKWVTLGLVSLQKMSHPLKSRSHFKKNMSH